MVAAEARDVGNHRLGPTDELTAAGIEGLREEHAVTAEHQVARACDDDVRRYRQQSRRRGSRSPMNTPVVFGLR